MKSTGKDCWKQEVTGEIWFQPASEEAEHGGGATREAGAASFGLGTGGEEDPLTPSRGWNPGPCNQDSRFVMFSSLIINNKSERDNQTLLVSN
ncbi:unnamed protein product [Microthlaspi erraticum]|uniref:Uncharacterized protein n=1 Tax=Microthlaspi erraticum TaxID=1685480 RepID=A0A6D2KP34_9BRAS|nr:unnamed protein product [Microthlaspi erraticum]CAA7058841.1 unnamed protein product [Microthlaspi erraticum]